MIGYLDIPSGISGDMFLGCLVDAGWPVEALRKTLEQLKLPASEWSVEAKVVMKGPMRATLVDVRVAEGHHHRGLAVISGIINAADLPSRVKQRATAVFTRLAQAEARVHGTTVEAIHFHEVGAMDAIVDIVGACAGLEALGIERLYCSALPMGQGWAQTDHGQIPLPAPATLEMLAAAKAPTRPAPGPGEWVTPTGAALVGELASFMQPNITVTRIGTGAGQRNCDWPNVARLWVGEATPADATGGTGGGGLAQIDTNIDDMNPQLFAVVSDALFAAGARDVWLTPVQMKKGRPAVVLSVLCDAAREAALADIMLRQTTTLGVRSHRVQRHEARREFRKVDTTFGAVTMKLKFVGEALCGVMPEFEDVRRLAQESKAEVKAVYDAALAAGQRLMDDAARWTPPVESPVPPAHDHDHSHTHDHGHSHDHGHGHDHKHGHE